MMNFDYNPNSFLVVRFIDHCRLALKPNIGDHTKNRLEKLGDAGLWIVEKLPKKVWRLMADPRVVTVALTAFAVLATSFAFYPTNTYLAIKAGLALLPVIPLWTVKFSAYLTTVGIIISAAMRAEGRFCNKELMDKFYKNNSANA